MQNNKKNFQASKDTKSNSPQDIPIPKITKVAMPSTMAPEQAVAKAFAPKNQALCESGVEINTTSSKFAT